MKSANISIQTKADLKPETLKIIQQVLDRIPQLPISVKKIIDMTMDDDIGAKELAEVALTDPVLSSRILTQVNSAYYALNHRIDDMRVAIVLIGFNAVRNIAIQNRFQQVFDIGEMEGMYEREKLWMHSYLVSVCAETFADEDDFKRLGELATMGILHDIGKYALYSIGILMKQKGIARTLDNEYEKLPHLQREELLFGVNHAIIGSMLADKWNLSERISTVIEHHHSPSFMTVSQIPEKYLDDVKIINLADGIVNLYEERSPKKSDIIEQYSQKPNANPSIYEQLLLSRKLILNKAVEFIVSLRDSY